MIYLYRLLFLPIFLLCIPFYLKRMFKRGGYSENFKNRFGLFKKLAPKKNKRIWIQAVSVGELNALELIIQNWIKDGDKELILTCTTSTAYALLKKKYNKRVSLLGFFPIDFWPFSYLAWKSLKPDIMILTEGDLWPEHLHQAQQHKAKLILLNGRISDRSFKRYAFVRPIAQYFFKKIDMVLSASQLDLNRFQYLGAKKSFFVGNLKLSIEHSRPLNTEEKIQEKAKLGLESKLILLGASSWEKEDYMLIDALSAALSLGINAGLILVPRHPERLGKLTHFLKKQTLKFHFHSSNFDVPSNLDIYIVDTIGQLKKMSQIADLAFVGKSIPPYQGGQNPIELAKMGIPLVYGPNMNNFKSICEDLENSKCSLKANSRQEALSIILSLMQDKQKRNEMSKNCFKWQERHENILTETLCLIQTIL